MNIEKLIQVVNLVLSKYKYKLDILKLLKLLYIADRESLLKTQNTITGCSFASLPQGPVLSELYDLFKGKYSDKEALALWNARFIKNENYLVSIGKEEISDDELSPFEENILIAVEEKYHQFSGSDLVNLLHNHEFCPEWQDPKGSSIPLKVESILRLNGKSEDEVKHYTEEKAIYEQERKYLESSCL